MRGLATIGRRTPGMGLQRQGSEQALPYSVDFTTLPDGALPAKISAGATWAVSGGKAVNSPAWGAELLTDGGVETWTSATNLTNWTEAIGGTSTVNREGTDKHGGSYSCREDVDASNTDAAISQSVTAAAGAWLLNSFWCKASASGKTIRPGINGTGPTPTATRDPGTTWTNYIDNYRTSGANPTISYRRATASSASVYFDDISIKAATNAEMFALYDAKTPYLKASVTGTLVKGAFLGVAAAMNAAKTYGLVAFAQGTNCQLWSVINGVWTNLVSGTLVTLTNIIVEIRMLNTNIAQLWINNGQVGTDQTITDGTILSSTNVGMFSTYSGNTITSFLVSPN